MKLNSVGSLKEADMGGAKIKHEFDINEDHLKWLKEMAAKYSLPDESKALRVLIDFAKTDGDSDLIFDVIRCLHCGG